MSSRQSFLCDRYLFPPRLLVITPSFGHRATGVSTKERKRGHVMRRWRRGGGQLGMHRKYNRGGAIGIISWDIDI